MSWCRLGRYTIFTHNKSDERVSEKHLTVYRSTGPDKLVEIIEAYFYTATHLGLTLLLDSIEHRFELTLGLPKLTLGLRGGRPHYPSREREYGWEFHNHTLWLFGGRSPDESSHDQPWWWKQTVDFKRLLFGAIRHKCAELGGFRFPVHMPEGDYPATVQLFERRYWSDRPLLGRLVLKTSRTATVTPDTPIPVPGKGENSWDIDDDAILDLHTPAHTVEEACLAMAETALRQRERYGGKEWQPGQSDII